MAVRKGFPSGRAHSAHLLRYASSMMASGMYLVAKPCIWTKWARLIHHFKVVSLLDYVLLYDIFWFFRPGSSAASDLIKEIFRIARYGAIITVYPTHVTPAEIDTFKHNMADTGFILDNEHDEELIHEEKMTKGTIMDFRKKGKLHRIKELESSIADLKARLPVHSVHPSMMQELEDMEEELKKLQDKAEKETEDN